MSSEFDDESSNFGEKTNIVTKLDTLKVKVDPNYKVPPCLMVMVGPEKLMGRQWNLERTSMILGRSHTAHLQIDELSISKNHARFELKDDGVYIADLGATNPTLVNNQSLTAHKPLLLANNDEIRMGNVVFKFLERGMLTETAEKARMQSELEAARSVQFSLMPEKPTAQFAGVKISGCFRSSSECAGDWWWYHAIQNKLFVAITDATGHGAGAALITSAARSAIATLEDDKTLGIEKIYTTLSQVIRKCSGGKFTMSGFIFEVHLQSKSVQFINASHVPALTLPQNSTGVDSKTIQLIDDPVSPHLGADKIEYAVGRSQNLNGKRIFLYTDGLVERKNAQDKMMSDRTFYNLVAQTHTSHPQDTPEFLRAVLKRSDEFAGSEQADDDITLVAIDL